jgi:hypothetical protein
MEVLMRIKKSKKLGEHQMDDKKVHARISHQNTLTIPFPYLDPKEGEKPLDLETNRNSR